MHDYEHSRPSGSGRDVVSAWILAAAVLFGLFAFSTVQQVVSNRPNEIVGKQEPFAIGENRAGRGDISAASVAQVLSYRPELAQSHDCYNMASLTRNLSALGANRTATGEADRQVRWLPGPSGDAKQEIGSEALCGSE